jgi:hypothetical protein
MVTLKPHVVHEAILVINLYVFVYVHHHHAPPFVYANHACHPLHHATHVDVVLQLLLPIQLLLPTVVICSFHGTSITIVHSSSTHVMN